MVAQFTYGGCSLAGSKHPKMPVLPYVILCPSRGGVQQGQLPPSPHGPVTTPSVPHHPLTCLPGLLCSLSHTLGPPPRMVQYLGCLCFPRCDMFLKRVYTSWDSGPGLSLNREGELASWALAPTILWLAESREGRAWRSS